MSTLRKRFPVLKEADLHLTSWCDRDRAPAFLEARLPDSLAKRIPGFALSHPSAYGRTPLAPGLELWIVEDYTGSCGTTFFPFVYSEKTQTLQQVEVPFAFALYGDNEPQAEGDNIFHDERVDAWILDYDRDGDKDFVLAGYTKGCTAGPRKADGEGFESICGEGELTPELWKWEGQVFKSAGEVEGEWNLAPVPEE